MLPRMRTHSARAQLVTKYHVTDNYCMELYQIITGPGGSLNKKDGLTRYGDSHVKDKTS